MVNNLIREADEIRRTIKANSLQELRTGQTQ
jgi:hypothetical protein